MPDESLQRCQWEGCTRKTVGPYCVQHEVAMLIEETREAADPQDILTRGLCALVSQGLAAISARVDRKAQTAPAAKKPTVDPFAVLMLDPKTATVAEVRRVQRELARIYHEDGKRKTVQTDAMAKINAAADAAVAFLQRRRDPLQ